MFGGLPHASASAGLPCTSQARGPRQPQGVLRVLRLRQAGAGGGGGPEGWVEGSGAVGGWVGGAGGARGREKHQMGGAEQRTCILGTAAAEETACKCGACGTASTAGQPSTTTTHMGE